MYLNIYLVQGHHSELILRLPNKNDTVLQYKYPIKYGLLMIDSIMHTVTHLTCQLSMLVKCWPGNKGN